MASIDFTGTKTWRSRKESNLCEVIDNLDYVEFHYRESIDGHETIRTLRITSEDATAYAGGDIKKAVGCEADLQRLIEKLNLTGG